jgi:DNA-binding transcriptional LysR family regulator
MNLDIIALQSFIAIASTHSFTKAAKKVCRTQSAISQQIARLEYLLGKKLLQRDKEIILTLDGEIFLEYAKKILKLHEEMLSKFNQTELEGEVKFGLPEDFATLFLADVLSNFTLIHPRIMLHIECDLTLNLMERFKKKEFDLVLVKMCKPQDFPNGQDILSEKLEWVGNIELNSKFKDSEILPLVLSPHPCVYRTRGINALEEKGIKWQLVFSSPSYNSTIAAVKAGLGISILPRIMVPKDLKIIHNNNLPKLEDTHISLLKHTKDNASINSFESFVLKKLI